jgi:copper transporter 1
MYWNWDPKIPYIFFKWWTAMTPAGLAFAVIMVFLLAFFYENVINLRAQYDAKIIAASTAHSEDSVGKGCCAADCCPCPSQSKMNRPFTLSESLVRSSLFAFSNFYSLFLMMIFMTYNAYLCIALVLGAGTGHFWSSIFIPESDPTNRPRSCCN